MKVSATVGQTTVTLQTYLAVGGHYPMLDDETGKQVGSVVRTGSTTWAVKRSPGPGQVEVAVDRRRLKRDAMRRLAELVAEEREVARPRTHLEAGCTADLWAADGVFGDRQGVTTCRGCLLPVYPEDEPCASCGGAGEVLGGILARHTDDGMLPCADCP